MLGVCVVDPNPGRRPQVRLVCLLRDEDVGPRQVRSVVVARDCERLTELSRPVSDCRAPAAELPHDFFTLDRHDPADQNTLSAPFSLRHRIHVPVHAVNEVDVGVPAWAEHNLISLRHPAMSVSRVVDPAQVAFCFSDLANQHLPTEFLRQPSVEPCANQVAGNLQRVPFIKRTRKN